jgi:predicted class III extradiol MEMO1 family dioxygenase
MNESNINRERERERELMNFFSFTQLSNAKKQFERLYYSICGALFTSIILYIIKQMNDSNFKI